MADQVLVFISHTAAMQEHPEGTSFVVGAESAVNAIDRAKAYHMAYFPAADMTPADYSVQQMSRADLFVAIIGFDLGSRVRGESRSYTELEFDEATRLRMPRLVFLLKPEAAHLQGMTTRDVRHEQLEFREKLEESGATVAYFGSVDDLKYKVQAAVTHWLADQQTRQQRQMATRTLPPPPVVPRARTLAASGCLVVVLAVAAIGLLAWTGIAARFPPWAAKAECEGVSIAVVDSAPSSAGAEGAVLEVEVENTTDRALRLPAGDDVIAKGRSGRQYAAGSALGDNSWFFAVTVQPRSTARLKLGLQGSGTTDRVSLTIPGVRGLGLPLTACEVTSASTPVKFGG